MGRTVGTRLLALIPTIIVGTFLVFSLQQLVPGGPAEAILGDHATAQNIAKINQELGLNRPLVAQYFSWLWKVLHGNLGTSYTHGTSVADSIRHALPLTLQLAIGALIMTVVLGIGLGLLAAMRPRGLVDRGILFFSGFGIAMPQFWAGILLVIVFCLHWHLFPAVGFATPGQGIGKAIHTTILPAFALALPGIAILMRQSRAAFLTVLDTEHMRVATALGVSQRTRIGLYLLRAAGVTLLTLIGLLANGILGGTVVVEIIFAIPGMGSLIVNSALGRDYPIVQGVVLLFIVMVVVINLLVDVGYIILDPRLRS